MGVRQAKRTKHLNRAVVKNNVRVELNRKDTGYRLNADGSITVLNGRRRTNPKRLVTLKNTAIVRRARKVGKHIEENSRTYFHWLIIAAGVMVMFAIVALVLRETQPYAISVDGKEVCYVQGESKADKLVNKLIEGYMPEDASLQAIDTEDRVHIDKAENFSEGIKQSVSLSDAVEAAQTAMSTAEKGPVTVTVVSAVTDVIDYEPTPNYERDDTMLAGESETVQEGTVGKAKINIRYTCVNGEIQVEEEVYRQIIKEGTPATIKKGTLGLPEGEDWQTYEGNPVFKDGDELITTSLKYLGAPYRYGGTSLKTGIDCVQFIRQMYAKYGINLPNGKNALKHVGKGISYADAQPGDIICYSHHYALYLGDGKIVHSTRGKGVSTRDNAQFMKIVSVRRVVQ